mmetsp:Transcript_24052/g.38683  ORF Transcript_24052/g.38683 Transcript_24052/m.38683 type:complete len:524 (+) Transcript_24052:56-1627(+)
MAKQPSSTEQQPTGTKKPFFAGARDKESGHGGDKHHNRNPVAPENQESTQSQVGLPLGELLELTALRRELRRAVMDIIALKKHEQVDRAFSVENLTALRKIVDLVNSHWRDINRNVNNEAYMIRDISAYRFVRRVCGVELLALCDKADVRAPEPIRNKEKEMMQEDGDEEEDDDEVNDEEKGPQNDDHSSGVPKGTKKPNKHQTFFEQLSAAEDNDSKNKKKKKKRKNQEDEDDEDEEEEELASNDLAALLNKQQKHDQKRILKGYRRMGDDLTGTLLTWKASSVGFQEEYVKTILQACVRGSMKDCFIKSKAVVSADDAYQVIPILLEFWVAQTKEDKEDINLIAVEAKIFKTLQKCFANSVFLELARCIDLGGEFMVVLKRIYDAMDLLTTTECALFSSEKPLFKKKICWQYNLGGCSDEKKCELIHICVGCGHRNHAMNACPFETPSNKALFVRQPSQPIQQQPVQQQQHQVQRTTARLNNFNSLRRQNYVMRQQLQRQGHQQRQRRYQFGQGRGYANRY